MKSRKQEEYYRLANVVSINLCLVNSNSVTYVYISCFHHCSTFKPYFIHGLTPQALYPSQNMHIYMKNPSHKISILIKYCKCKIQIQVPIPNVAQRIMYHKNMNQPVNANNPILHQYCHFSVSFQCIVIHWVE